MPLVSITVGNSMSIWVGDAIPVGPSIANMPSVDLQFDHDRFHVAWQQLNSIEQTERSRHGEPGTPAIETTFGAILVDWLSVAEVVAELVASVAIRFTTDGGDLCSHEVSRTAKSRKMARDRSIIIPFLKSHSRRAHRAKIMAPCKITGHISTPRGQATRWVPAGFGTSCIE